MRITALKKSKNSNFNALLYGMNAFAILKVVNYLHAILLYLIVPNKLLFLAVLYMLII